MITVFALSPSALTAIVLVVMLVAIVVGWRSLRTQIRRIEPEVTSPSSPSEHAPQP